MLGFDNVVANVDDISKEREVVERTTTWNVLNNLLAPTLDPLAP
jgi:hypothetical protein